jgi:cytosol alanyl aminopeptidase
VPVRIVTLKGRGPDAAFAAQSTPKILDLVETWFGSPYPFEKLDILTIPLTIGFGAMENAGLITSAESFMLFDPKTLSQQQRNTYVIFAAHEISHQWFGDLVTMSWWDDLWLNEGFANWLEGKITAQYEPAWGYDLSVYDGHQWALLADSVVTARRVRQPITTVDDIESAFDGITYSKGSAVLSMFENFVGPQVFQRGVRAYIKARSWANATSADFVSAISTAAGKDLTAAFGSFLDQVGAPEIDTKLVCDKSGAKLEVSQQRHVGPGSPVPTAQQTWQIPLCIAFENNAKRATTCSLFTEKTGSVALPTKGCPRWVMPNLDGNGHYRVRYTQQQAKALRDEAWDKLSASERRSVFNDVHGMVYAREHRLPLQSALSFVPKLLAKGNRFVVNDALAVPWSVERKVPSDLADKYAYYMRTTFGPGAAKLGLVPGAKETLDDETLRTSLVTAVAWDGRDPDLVAKAVELVGNWRDLPASTRGLVLKLAVDADANIAAKMMRDVKSEQDRARRQEMLAALASQRDMKRYDAALELVFDPALDIRETMAIVWSTSTEATRATAERFVRLNEAKILAKFPSDAVLGLSGGFASLFAGSCDPAKRDEAKAYATAHYAKLPGGQIVIDQVFEEMDKCIANRELALPQVRAWLGGLRIPKPTKR